MRKKRGTLILATILAVCAFALATTWIYTHTQLELARARYAVYPIPEEGMNVLLWQGQHQIEAKYIKYSGPSCFIVCSPHIWFVHVAGIGVGGGAYFLHTKDGWVHVPESSLTDFIGLGMLLFGLTP